ncbi:MAG: TetR/AcrR family transcriptional regulator [Cyclobacteriaceae bacterium]|jgi:AcrR family transcriptional regulator|nr:TetR/AcrR family transcriptional regulator [Cyclobacteriaceae bacterium]MBX2958044.1 TetR/AcrR family transcriptional regulator [Cyclobacteriaceae bacterium]HRJ29644.1 TetR/AcrR family transcriptional regulator [Cyclobacteriaceae bacterium]HRJ81430.1 TetR/AcrR family transcriptional regulator [Cyclobacteriaceae bacterium]
MEKDEIIIQEIINGAKKLMQQYGLKKTTMEDIAQTAGKSKSTLYYYFKDKEEIFDKVINLEIDEFFQTVKTSVNKQADAISMLKAYIVTKVKILRDKTNLYSIAIKNDLQGRVNKGFTNLRNRYDNEEKLLISSILTKGVESKLFTNEIKNEIDTLSELLVSCIRGIEMDIIAHNKNKALADKADLLVEILIKGIGR